MSDNSPEFILASSSRYKKQTLAKLGIPFRTISPDIDEAPLEMESSEELVRRLAAEKCQKALQSDTQFNTPAGNKYYIGIDQVATFDGNIIGKSHTVENAIQQLKTFSGQTVLFLTGISLLGTNNELYSHVEPFEVSFKRLTEQQIIKYVHSEMPLDCAGSFKCEGQGILLFESLNGRDINSLVGMPLLAFQELCLNFGIDLFDLL